MPHERQQLMQEFFFHAVAAIEMVAQLVNEARLLGKSAEVVNPLRVAKALPVGDPIRSLLACSYAYPKRDPMPADPYNDAGMIWRLWNYRHQVSHRGRNPFLFRVGSSPPVSLLVDPRSPGKDPSKKAVQAELEEILQLVEGRCKAILAHLP